MRFEILCKIDWLSIRSEAYVCGIIGERENVPDIISESEALVKEIEDILGYNPTLTQLYYEMASYFFEAKNLDFYEQRLKDIQGRTIGDDMKNLPELGEAIRRIRKAQSQGVITPNEKKAIEKNIRMLVGLWIEIIESIGADIESIKSGLKRPQQSRKKREADDTDVYLTDEEKAFFRLYPEYFRTTADGKMEFFKRSGRGKAWKQFDYIIGSLYITNDKYNDNIQRLMKYFGCSRIQGREDGFTSMGDSRVNSWQTKINNRKQNSANS